MLREAATSYGDFLRNISANEPGARSAEWLALLQCANPQFSADRLSECFSKPFDWPRLVMLAEEQGLLPLLTKRLGELREDVAPSEIRQELRDAARARTLFTLSLTAELFRVLDRCAALGIEILLTKGPVLSARCYGDPGLRQYTDLDLVLRNADIARATEAMMALSYDPKIPLQAIRTGRVPGEYVFFQSGTKLLVELHTERTFRYHPKPLSIEKLFERQTRVRFDGHDVPALSVEDELILICIHGAKHFWERLMWIADVAALVTHQSVDWNRAILAAREVQAERMLRVGLLLATNVAGAKLPAKIVDKIGSDVAAVRVAARIARRLPVVNDEPFGLLERAAFRIGMRGGFPRGVAYLLRLSVSPTEEDWLAGAGEKRAGTLDAISRPFRLARKYGRSGKG
jgi:Uncharacterised nucleotidyltransferase